MTLFNVIDRKFGFCLPINETYYDAKPDPQNTSQQMARKRQQKLTIKLDPRRMFSRGQKLGGVNGAELTVKQN